MYKARMKISASSEELFCWSFFYCDIIVCFFLFQRHCPFQNNQGEKDQIRANVTTECVSL